jgi:hypothetical protein
MVGGKSLAFCVALLVLSAVARGQVSPGVPAGGAQKPGAIPGLTDRAGANEQAAGGELLGEMFENPAAGIAFRPPAGCTQIRKTDTDHVAEYIHDQKQWLLKVTRARLSQDMLLQTTKERGADGKMYDKVGLLDYTVKDVLKQHPAAEVLRNDIVNVGEYPCGIAVFRLNLGTQKFLRQQAIVQDHEKLYYVFNFTSPAGEGAAGSSAVEKSAVETFNQMLDTIQILDRTKIKEDQVQRLFRTRALFTDWNSAGGKRIKEAVVPEQWLRLMREGKDIGYSYVVEEVVNARDVRNNPGRTHDGVLISVRSRTVEAGNQVDIGSQLFVSLDRKHEDWAHVVNLVLNKGKPDQEKKQTMEFGYSENKVRRVLDKDAIQGPRTVKKDEQNPNLRDAKNPAVRDVESYVVRIERAVQGRNHNAQPETHAPSPWYIPQAVGSMLPRLVPLQRPVTYLFQSYISEQHEVMHRYVDVGFEKEVTLGGKKVRAIPIRDRIRMEGTPTVHYMSIDGKYLGSVNEEAKVTILPSDRGTIERIWKDADLRKQEDIVRPEGAVGAAPGR